MHFFFCLLLLCIRIACLVLCFNLSFDVIRKLNPKCSLECSTKRFSREERHVSKATPQNHALTYLSILYIVFVAPLHFPCYFLFHHFLSLLYQWVHTMHRCCLMSLRLRINEGFLCFFVELVGKGEECDRIWTLWWEVFALPGVFFVQIARQG